MKNSDKNFLRSHYENYRNLLKGTGCGSLIKDAYYIHVYRNKSSAKLNELSWQLREKRQVIYIDK